MLRRGVKVELEGVELGVWSCRVFRFSRLKCEVNRFSRMLVVVDGRVFWIRFSLVSILIRS